MQKIKKDKRIDAYILKAQPFARPVLKRIRKMVHNNCPEVEETIKWGFPHFMYDGSILCSMAAFNQHCALTFWKADKIPSLKKVILKNGNSAMGQFGKIASLNDLPGEEEFARIVEQAMRLQTTNSIKETKKKAIDVVVPDYFMDRLRKNKLALKTFESFPNSHKKEYVEWVTEAKREETRNRRMEQAIDMMQKGKDKNWKYR